MGLTDLIAGGMDSIDATALLINVMWTMLGAILVYFMQAGFAMCEAGFTRAKNTGNILMKNMMDFVLGSIFFFIFGFALMHGTDWNGIVGIKGFRWDDQWTSGRRVYYFPHSILCNSSNYCFRIYG